MSNYFSDSDLDDLMFSEEYADYIMDHAPGDRPICNGDMLTVAMEDGYLWEDFLDFMEAKLRANEAE